MRVILAITVSALIAVATPAAAQTLGDAAKPGLAKFTRVGDAHSRRLHRRYAGARNYDWGWGSQRAYEGYAVPPAGGGWNYSHSSGGGDGFIPGDANGS